MGAEQFIRRGYGRNLKEAYDYAHSVAEEELGHQEGYSGDINSAGSCVDKTKSFKDSKRNIHQFIDNSWDELNKRDCWAVCTEEPKDNTYKVKSSVENIVTTGTKQWVLKYQGSTSDHGVIFSENTKTEAIKKARVYVERQQRSVYIHIVKVLKDCNSLVATVSYKQSPGEKKGTWVFFGLGAS